MPTEPTGSALGVDYGTKQVGLAICSLTSRLPRPYKTIANSGHLINEIAKVVKDENVQLIVVGLPRSLSGHHTQQTRLSMDFIDQLKLATTVPIYVKDEALTSVLAEEELSKNHALYDKSDVDALAASYI